MVVADSEIPIWMEILELVKTQEFKSHGKRMQLDNHDS